MAATRIAGGMAIGGWGDVIAVIDIVASETMLFAKNSFLIAGWTIWRSISFI